MLPRIPHGLELSSSLEQALGHVRRRNVKAGVPNPCLLLRRRDPCHWDSWPPVGVIQRRSGMACALGDNRSRGLYYRTEVLMNDEEPNNPQQSEPERVQQKNEMQLA